MNKRNQSLDVLRGIQRFALGSIAVAGIIFIAASVISLPLFALRYPLIMNDSGYYLPGVACFEIFLIALLYGVTKMTHNTFEEWKRKGR